MNARGNAPRALKGQHLLSDVPSTGSQRQPLECVYLD